ncbi:MAG: hypothetical protein ACRD0V_19000 [Acidimicrobiales bacterium]
MGTLAWKRRHCGVLVALVLGLTSVWPATRAGAQEPERQTSDSLPVEEPPPDPDPGDGGGGGAELPPEAPAEIQAVIDDVAAPVAAAAESDAAAEFLRALLVKIADLQARFGAAATPGEVIPFDVLNQIATELRNFLEPYARQICDNKLVLPGISEEVQARLSFRWWYPLVPPYFFGWLFGRKSICVNRLLDEATTQLLPPCAIAIGHFETFWTSQRPRTFRSYDDAQADSIAYLIGQGVPYAIAWQIYTVHGTPMCVHN